MDENDLNVPIHVNFGRMSMVENSPVGKGAIPYIAGTGRRSQTE
jgi:hypothetical protein